MWKVLLVEDEAFIRRTIRSSMPWAEMGFQVAGEAANGIEALELIRELRPHAVISDIKMPAMDGIALLKQVRAEGFDCRFVMLTVMNDFEHAQQALEYGASGYVLKLYLTPDKMKEVLGKVAAELREKSRSEALHMTDFYTEAWESATSIEPHDEPRPLPQYPAERFQLAVSISRQWQQPGAEHTFLELFPAELRQHIHLHHRGVCMTAFIWLPAEGAGAIRILPPKEGVMLASGPQPSDRLCPVWKLALEGVSKYWYNGRQGLFYLTESDSGAGGSPLQLPWTEEQRAVRALELGDRDELVQAAQDMMAGFEARGVSFLAVRTLVQRFDRLLAQVAGTGQEPAAQLDRTVTHTELTDLLLARAVAYIEKQLERKRLLTDHPDLNRMLAFMHEHYHEELTLEQLAEIAAMDDKYVSGLFKKKTGRTITHYLQELRVGQACFYLQHTDWPVALIGEKVGFASENYFAKIFRRFHDMTPSVYRHLHSK